MERRSVHKRHHGRRHSKLRRKQIAISAVICVAAAAILAGMAYSAQKRQKAMSISAGNSYDVGSGYRNIVYNGETYQYNNRITNILYAGIDSEGKMESTVQFGNKARADSIALVVMDEKHKKLTILPINRDTMTEIRRYTMNGNDKGLYTSHIGYAYSYADGGKVSCESLCEAVSNLFGGIPVKRYVVTNQDSMPYINDLAGGITLTVPNSDLEEQYPDFAEGTTVTLDSGNIRTFLQYRDTEDAFSNTGRMERQKAYVTAYIEKIKSMSRSQLEDSWESLEVMDDYLQTSIAKNQYLELAELMQKLDFSEDNYETLEGENKEGELHDEFYLDEEALQEKIIELFYEKI
ncbi:LCP family protein [Ruminococcus sp. 5_1_39BFAA]|uniref:LCP family protein n=1 Tax=Ruminococcus sp. 5_1_39BFAA TaxID=457412 RepID=UPI0035664A9A